MGRCKITATNSDIGGCAYLEVHINNKRLFIAPSSLDRTQPEMYNYNSEQLFFVEVPYEALAVDATERAAGKLRKVMTLAKMEKAIASGGKSYKINPAYGVKTSEIESFTFRLKSGESITAIPQEGQYRFYSNRGITKILGFLEQTGVALDFFSILNFGLNGDKKELLPIPGPLGVLNLPMKRYFDDFEEGLREAEKEMLKRAKKEGVEAVRRLINSGMYEEHSLLQVSNELVKRIINGEIKTFEEIERIAGSEDEPKIAYILCRQTEDREGFIVIVETFFFNSSTQ